MLPNINVRLFAFKSSCWSIFLVWAILLSNTSLLCFYLPIYSYILNSYFFSLGFEIHDSIVVFIRRPYALCFILPCQISTPQSNWVFIILVLFWSVWYCIVVKKTINSILTKEENTRKIGFISFFYEFHHLRMVQVIFKDR